MEGSSFYWSGVSAQFLGSNKKNARQLTEFIYPLCEHLMIGGYPCKCNPYT